ncbi:MAG: BlaI/MecI/CopY family transcriptional regulator [bacterium]
MKKTKKLTEAEWDIMECVWQLSRSVTVREVHERLYPQGQKAYTTVQTTMNILADKGFLKKEKIGMVNFYTPTLSRAHFAKRETHTFVSRIFKGSFGALAHYLVQSGRLSPEELEHLRGLIDEKEKNRGGQS